MSAPSQLHLEDVLVTGGSGLLGAFVVEALEPDCHVTVLDIKPPSGDTAYCRADILDTAALERAMAGRDAVVHLAGIDDGNDFPDKDYFETNVQGAWNVLHAAEAASVRKLVVASSSAVYGIGRARMPDYIPLDERHAARPSATYALSKQVIETICRSYARRGELAVTCLRPTLIVRPEREAAILAQLALDDPDNDPPVQRGVGAVEPYGALSPLRSYVRSRDAARCFRLALFHRGDAFEVFNVSAADTIGREHTLERLERLYGRLPEVRDPARYRADPHAGLLDASRARERLGWQPEGDWREVVAAHEPRGAC